MYLSSVLMLLVWPLVILISLILVRFALGKYEKAQIKENRKQEKEL